MSDLEESTERGNHKSARGNHDELVNVVSKAIKFGCQLKVSIETIRKVNHACIQPCGIAFQSTVDEKGSVYLKTLLIHDQSWKWKWGTSVNSQFIKEDLMSMTRGKALKHHVHYAHSMRRHNLSTSIIQCK